MRRSILLLLGATFMTLSLPANGQSDDVLLWKSLPPWAVHIDKTMDSNCFTSNVFNDGTIFRLGFHKEDSNHALYVAFGNLSWSSIETGKDYDLTLQIDNEAPWVSPATGLRLGTIPFLTVNTSQVDFINQIMKKHSLRAYFNNKLIAHLSLAGSFAAFRELGACQDTVSKLKEQKLPPKDPFSGVTDTPKKEDPFSL